VLITGIGGFAGSHLADLLVDQPEVEVFGAGRSAPGRLEHLQGRVAFRRVDLEDAEAAEQVVAEARPDRLYHLVGRGFGLASWQDPWGTLETNLHCQVNVLEAVLRAHSPTRVLVVGSIESHGAVSAADLPIVESTPMRPASPYAVSKAAQDLLGLQYFLGHHLQVVRVRPVNHIGPRQEDSFAISGFARQIAEIEAGRRPPVLAVGNLSAQRDFTDVRDMVRAYHLALERGVAGEAYVVGRGRPVAVSHLVDLLLAAARVPIEVRPDPARLRPVDVPVSFCDPARFRAQTGWEPLVSLEQTLADTLDYWRARIAATG